MAERLTLPVLPLREVVLFPGVTAPIGAGRPATLRAIEAALVRLEGDFLRVAVEGPIGEVGGLLATQVVDFLQGVQYPNWENPHPQLTWIAPAFPQTRVRAELAVRYCEGQRARLPFASVTSTIASASSPGRSGNGPGRW